MAGWEERFGNYVERLDGDQPGVAAELAVEPAAIGAVSGCGTLLGPSALGN